MISAVTQDAGGVRVLLEAVNRGLHEAAEVLLQNGAEAQVARGNKTALLLAAEKGDLAESELRIFLKENNGYQQQNAEALSNDLQSFWR